MKKEDKINYWRDISGYDLDTAKAMYETKRYLYVGFMCHQVIEKIFKAYYIYLKNEEPPYIHNLAKISDRGGFYITFSEDQKDFIDYLEPLNIEARYPTRKDELMKSLSGKKCKTIIKKTEELYRWIEVKLS